MIKDSTRGEITESDVRALEEEKEKKVLPKQGTELMRPAHSHTKEALYLEQSHFVCANHSLIN